MKKLLTTLGLFLFLTSPALAGHIILEHGKSYTDAVVSCSSKTDAMGFIHTIKSTTESLSVDRLTVDHMKTAAQNNNCVFQIQYFVYLKTDYVCQFDAEHRVFTLLNIEVEGIKQYMAVYAPVNPTDIIRPLQCIQERQPN